MDKPVKERQVKLTPEEYREILKGVEFISASLVNLNYNLNISSVDKPPTFSLEERPPSILSKKEGFISIIYPFHLSGNLAEEEIVKIEGRFVLEFSSKSDFSNKFFDIFKDVTLRIFTWPYLRELFASMATRSNFPPIILPLFKLIPPDKST